MTKAKVPTEEELENKLWNAATALRGTMDASEYSNVVLGLIFLKYVSDSFNEEYHNIKNSKYPDEVEDQDVYIADGVFWLPKESRWNIIHNNAKSPKIGQIINKAMDGIEHYNDSLKGILPKDYTATTLRTGRLGRVIDLISSITVGTKETQSRDVLGRTYEYFLKNFALEEGHRGGEFYTPRSVVRTLVEMIEPYKGRVYDPCCGSGGMFVQSQAFIKDHQGNPDNISVYGQELNAKTWRLCKMNLAIRGIDNNLGSHPDDTFTHDLHKGRRFDFILANPPFNQKYWGANELKQDPRWKYGVPPDNNANYAWLQHIISKLSPNGRAGIVLANGSLSTDVKSQLRIRKGMVDDDKVDAIVALPNELFYSVTIPAALWILNNNKGNHSGKTLFINARHLGHMVDRTHRTFTKNDIAKISNTYHSFINNVGYKNQIGYCKVVTTNQIVKKNYNLIPGRYVGFKHIHLSQKLINSNVNKYSKIVHAQFQKEHFINDNISQFLRNMHNSGYIFSNFIKQHSPKDTITNLEGIAHYQNGLAVKNYRPKDNKHWLPVMKIRELEQEKIDNKSDKVSSDIKPQYIVHDGDIIFSWSASLMLKIWYGGTVGLNQHLFKVTSSKYPKWFYFMWIFHYLNEFKRIAIDKATTMGHIKRSDLNHSKVIIPNTEEWNKLESIFKPIYDYLDTSKKESKALMHLGHNILLKFYN